MNNTIRDILKRILKGLINDIENINYGENPYDEYWWGTDDAERKIKENALENFVKMTEQSWTYEKMTQEEKSRLVEVFYGGTVENSLKGTYKQRWKILQAVYYGFLMGLDYKPIGWRENTEDIPKF